MKIFLLVSLFLLSSAKTSIYKFKIPALEGGIINMESFKGKKILIVNTASKCGFTPQLEELQKLQEQYKNKLVVIGFPANNFNQDTGTNEEIKEFCKRNYGVSFLMAEKVSVKGENAHPLFKYLTSESKKLGINDPVKWNFTKFLIDEKGKLVKVFESKVKPLSPELIAWIK